MLLKYCTLFSMLIGFTFGADPILEKIEQTLEDAIKRMDVIQSHLTETQTQLANVQNAAVPVGFIYAQLAGQPEPSALWPALQWSDVSGTYGGLFFRVEGGNAGQFGAIQEENSPRLVGVRSGDSGTKWEFKEYPIPANGEYTGIALTAFGITNTKSGTQGFYGHSYKVSGGEVRPRNQAIKIWRRVA